MSAIDHFLAARLPRARYPAGVGARRRSALPAVRRASSVVRARRVPPSVAHRHTNDDDFILQLAACRLRPVERPLSRPCDTRARQQAWVAARRVSYMFVQRQILTAATADCSASSAAGRGHGCWARSEARQRSRWDLQAAAASAREPASQLVSAMTAAMKERIRSRACQRFGYAIPIDEAYMDMYMSMYMCM